MDLAASSSSVAGVLLGRIDVRAAIREFFSRGRLLRQTNATFINLIPKVDSPFLVKDFRPIACCNTILKLITKVLVLRIRPLLDELFSPNQGGVCSESPYCGQYCCCAGSCEGI